MKPIESNPSISAPSDSDFQVDALKVLQDLPVCSALLNNRGLPEFVYKSKDNKEFTCHVK